MQLYHVSEEPDIRIFEPRKPKRQDLDPDVGLVWALCERTLPNFLTPRNCPRVTYHIGKNTTVNDIENHLPSGISHAVIIEDSWLEQMKKTTLYLYVFESRDFYLQDEVAGYYVSEKTHIPVKKIVVNDLIGELGMRGVILRTAGNLWDISEEIKQTSFNWSNCRMAFAKPREEAARLS